MDDWLIIANTRRQFRRATKKMRRVLEELSFELHPDKTSIGRVEKGFDFLGYHFLVPGVNDKNMTPDFFLLEMFNEYS